MSEARPIAIVGAGSIGVGWAIVFAMAGFPVRLQDPDPARRGAVAAELAGKLEALADAGLRAGPLREATARVAVCGTLAEAVADAIHVQECAPERLEVKRPLFADLVRLAPRDATLASSSSAIVASAFAPETAGRERCMVLHPGNPPFLLRVVEVVPAPFTDPEATGKAERLLARAGMMPVRVAREVEGFVFNRLQGAVLREAYCLVRDGVIAPEDLDKVMTEGLGLRWAVVGPFETADLNTRGGIASHALKMGPAYARMGAERGQNDPWSPDLVARVAAARRAAVPFDQWERRVAWRDAALSHLVRAKRQAPPYGPDES
jgi:3-hydroxyacyl-CoA dehydrogenase